MEQRKLDRINELARKSRDAGLTPEEKAEQQALRQEYVAAYRQSLKAQLDGMVVVDEHGNRRRLSQRPRREGPEH